MVREPPVSGDPVGAAKRARCERAGALRLLGDESSAAAADDAAAAKPKSQATITFRPKESPLIEEQAKESKRSSRCERSIESLGEVLEPSRRDPGNLWRLRDAK